MSLELIVPPTEEPVGLAELKAHLRVDHADEDDAIEAYARAARRAVEARGRLAITAQVWRLTLDKAPAAPLALPKGPVYALDDVAVVDREGLAQSVDPALYDFAPGLIGRLIPRGAFPRSERTAGGYRIDFVAGYADAASAPEELKLAVKMLAAHFYENREASNPERVFAAPLAVDALIAPYRQVRL
jgi:uncharacterized phiE125 gp8 family phage protein